MESRHHRSRSVLQGYVEKASPEEQADLARALVGTIDRTTPAEERHVPSRLVLLGRLFSLVALGLALLMNPPALDRVTIRLGLMPIACISFPNQLGTFAGQAFSFRYTPGPWLIFTLGWASLMLPALVLLPLSW